MNIQAQDVSYSNAPSVKLTCNETLIALTVKHNLARTTFHTLANWLECYEYVYPVDRILHTHLLKLVTDFYFRTVKPPRASDIFKLWLVLDILEYNCPLASQERIYKWMRDCNYLVIPAF